MASALAEAPPPLVPPHGNQLGPAVFRFEAPSLLDTVGWLTSTLQEQHSSLWTLERSIAQLKAAIASVSPKAAEQIAQLAANEQPAVGHAAPQPAGASTSAPGHKAGAAAASPAGSPNQIAVVAAPTLKSASPAAGAAADSAGLEEAGKLELEDAYTPSTDLAGLVRALQKEVAACKRSQHVFDDYMKRQMEEEPKMKVELDKLASGMEAMKDVNKSHIGRVDNAKRQMEEFTKAAINELNRQLKGDLKKMADTLESSLGIEMTDFKDGLDASSNEVNLDAAKEAAAAAVPAGGVDAGMADVMAGYEEKLAAAAEDAAQAKAESVDLRADLEALKDAVRGGPRKYEPWGGHHALAQARAESSQGSQGSRGSAYGGGPPGPEGPSATAGRGPEGPSAAAGRHGQAGAGGSEQGQAGVGQEHGQGQAGIGQEHGQAGAGPAAAKPGRAAAGAAAGRPGQAAAGVAAGKSGQSSSKGAAAAAAGDAAGAAAGAAASAAAGTAADAASGEAAGATGAAAGAATSAAASGAPGKPGHNSPKGVAGAAAAAGKSGQSTPKRAGSGSVAGKSGENTPKSATAGAAAGAVAGGTGAAGTAAAVAAAAAAAGAAGTAAAGTAAGGTAAAGRPGQGASPGLPLQPGALPGAAMEQRGPDGGDDLLVAAEERFGDTAELMARRGSPYMDRRATTPLRTKTPPVQSIPRLEALERAFQELSSALGVTAVGPNGVPLPFAPAFAYLGNGDSSLGGDFGQSPASHGGFAQHSGPSGSPLSMAASTPPTFGRAGGATPMARAADPGIAPVGGAAGPAWAQDPSAAKAAAGPFASGPAGHFEQVAGASTDFGSTAGVGSTALTTQSSSAFRKQPSGEPAPAGQMQQHAAGAGAGTGGSAPGAGPATANRAQSSGAFERQTSGEPAPAGQAQHHAVGVGGSAAALRAQGSQTAAGEPAPAGRAQHGAGAGAGVGAASPGAGFGGASPGAGPAGQRAQASHGVFGRQPTGGGGDARAMPVQDSAHHAHDGRHGGTDHHGSMFDVATSMPGTANRPSSSLGPMGSSDGFMRTQSGNRSWSMKGNLQATRLEEIEAKIGDLAAMVVFGGDNHHAGGPGSQRPGSSSLAKDHVAVKAPTSSIAAGMPQAAPAAIDSPGLGLAAIPGGHGPDSPLNGGQALFENWETVVRPRLSTRRGGMNVGPRFEKLEMRVTVLEGLVLKLEGMVVRNEDGTLATVTLGGGAPTEEKAQDVAPPGGSSRDAAGKGARGKRSALIPGSSRSPSKQSLGLSSEMQIELESLRTEVRQLKGDMVDTRKNMKSMHRELEALQKGAASSRARTPASKPATASASPAGATTAGPDLDTVSSAERAEAAARAAEDAAAEALRLRQEVEEYVKAVQIPLAQSLDDTEDHSPKDGDKEDPASSEAAKQYMDRQMAIENQLMQMERKLEEGLLRPDGKQDDGEQKNKANEAVMEGLRGIVQDVRKCLQRCELLMQLPEIRMFIRRFQRSLEVNAILHEKWIGPLGERSPKDESGSPKARDAAGRRGMPRRHSDMSMSAPDFHKMLSAPDSPSGLSEQADHMRGFSRGGGAPGQKKLANVKKKPFRTVVDWCRPHTPLQVEPVLHVAESEQAEVDHIDKKPPDRVRLPTIAKAS